MTILIATSKVVSKANWERFKSDVQSIAFNEFDVNVGEFELRAGPGCANLAVELQGDTKDMNAFANALTMQLMPSRWCETDSKIEPGHFIDL